jgi:ATP adenylyltransferase
VTTCTIQGTRLWGLKPATLAHGTVLRYVHSHAYEELVDFLEHKMSMSHVYQPLLVRALVDAGGVATVRQLAQVFLVQDESQLLYYEKRIKEMPLKVLKRHEVIASDGRVVSLNTNNLTLVQKAHIRMICEQKLQSFVQKRGIGIWDYRLLDDDPIPDSLRFLN